jgi:hypothetical protein
MLRTPLRWPGVWKDSSALDLLKNTAIDHLVIDKSSEFDAVRTAARRAGIETSTPDQPPRDVAVIKGEWPGVRMGRGSGGAPSGGPTGVPWVDSNGWSVRLAAAMNPQRAVWVDAAPPANFRLPAGSYLTAIADSAAHGGRWIINLDPQLAEGIAGASANMLGTWRSIAAAAGFFAAHQEWSTYAPAAVAAVVSDFTGDNEFFSRELLNLLARAGLHYRIVLKNAAISFAGLRAAIYADAAPPSTDLRAQFLSFVQSGGLLITVPKWGDAPGTLAKTDTHPRYVIREFGKGRIAMAKETPGDPYEMANDATEIISHRHDLVRFWNGGATGSYCAMAPGGKSAVAHLLFYSNRGPDMASVRIAGPYRRAEVATVDNPRMPNVEVQLQKDALELHLPQVPQYVAVELSGG